MKNPYVLKCMLFLFYVLLSETVAAQDRDTTKTVDTAKAQVTVFIDCNTGCDLQYVKTDLNFVDFAPDRFTSNVYIMLTGQTTGSGGKELVLYFSGSQKFAGMEDTLRFFRNSVDTDDEYRKTLLQYLKLGLTRYISKTALAPRLTISATPKGGEKEEAINALSKKSDKWNFWVFTVGLNGSLNSDDFSRNLKAGGDLNAGRVTEKLKMNFNVSTSKNERKITYNGDESTFIINSSNFNGTIVKSIRSHIGIGGFINARRSTFSNYDVEVNVYPAIEYSIFPYKDAVKKLITILYQAGKGYKNYIDTSYYGAVSQWTTKQDLSVNVGFIQKWGNINAYVSYENFLNSFALNNKTVKGSDINNLSFGGNMEFRILKGLSVELSSRANFTKGIYPNIARKSFSRDALLTNSQQYPTQRGLNVNMGINYRFGSIYNNVVNPRFTGRR